ncbi:MAG: endonuclease/exonuclease/phosphatase family protein, partial [Methylomonas sp.]
MTDIIQLLTVDNRFGGKTAATQQLVFQLRLANLGYDKQVDVIWCGKDGIWKTLSAGFVYSRGDGQECWQASMVLHGKPGQPLPGTIQF